MVIVIMVVLGLCLGSFVNALVWRLHEQSGESRKASAAAKKRLSIISGRSLCPHCHRDLAAKDLVPLVSYLSLGGKCRYCQQPISIQYPIVELATAGLFALSYLFWPSELSGSEIILFGLWLGLITGFMALLVYDLRWFLLPNRLIYPLAVLGGIYAAISILSDDKPLTALISTIIAVAIGGGIFYLLFQMSGGKWIGGGDVKLGWLLGLVLGTPGQAILCIFAASLLGTAVSLPLLYRHRLTKKSIIPFGPFLIAGAIIAQLFGADILDWYKHLAMIG